MARFARTEQGMRSMRLTLSHAIVRPEQILSALPHAVEVMTDAALCGPVCLALPQDVQAQAFDCPRSFLAERIVRFRRPGADAHELAEAAALLRSAQRPLIVAGG